MKKSIIIEVQGIGIRNKGAELMLLAISEHFKNTSNDVDLVLPADNYYKIRSKYQALQKGQLQYKGIDLSFLFKLIPKRLRMMYGIVLDEEIDVVIDASGFAYGDQWGRNKFKNRVHKKIDNWSSNKKVVFLPQAFGPFSQENFKELVHDLLSSNFLIFAREATSWGELNNVKPNAALLAPDFTCLLNPDKYVSHQNSEYGICFIPNNKMIEMRYDGDIYLEMMASAVQAVAQDGQKVSFLLHEGDKDLDLCKAIIHKAGFEVPILVSDDPLEIKYIILHCKAVVSSRFHGLVSSLSQGIPAVAIGWSHKYRHLMEDYSSEDLLVEDLEQLPEVVVNLLRDDFLNQRRIVLEKCSSQQKKLASDMWLKVDKYLDI